MSLSTEMRGELNELLIVLWKTTLQWSEQHNPGGSWNVHSVKKQPRFPRRMHPEAADAFGSIHRHLKPRQVFVHWLMQLTAEEEDCSDGADDEFGV
jgi:hypothetical protein